MRYLFDTDTVSALTRGSAPAALMMRMARTAPEDRTTSTVTLAELLFGAHRMGLRSAEFRARIAAAVVRQKYRPLQGSAPESEVITEPRHSA